MSRPSYTLLENKMEFLRTPELFSFLHHPEEQVAEVRGSEVVSTNPSTRKCCKRNWNTTRAVVANAKARAATLPFEHFNALGMDGIYPGMLKEGTVHLGRLLGNIFRGCPAPRYMSTS